jgi:8-oxo-dGTP pyrophosphatase MutT (NUDIX family)
MYIVFIAEKPFIIAENRDVLPMAYRHVPEVPADRFLRDLPYVLLRHNPSEGCICLTDDVEGTWRIFLSHFKVITAAGGIVRNEKGQMLWIYRNGFWDLPKGKTEAGEDPGPCAEREVTEECGIQKLRSGRQLITTYHTYTHHNKFFLKVTDWFEMTCSSSEKLIPQTEEGIELIRWFDPQDLREPIEGTYESLRYLLKSLESANA